MDIIVGGIKGLAQTISFKKKEPNQELKLRFSVPENDICVHDFNCALQDKILLQGNLYVYNTMICFHSQFNKNSIVGLQDTLITIPFGQIILIEKKKKFLFDNSIQFTTVDESFFFTSFLSRDKAFNIISEYLELYQKMLPKPYQQIQNNDIYVRQQQLNQIDNEAEWLQQAILSIQKMESDQQQNQIREQQDQNLQNANNNLNNNNRINQENNNHNHQQIEQQMTQSRIRSSQQQDNLVQPCQISQQNLQNNSKINKANNLVEQQLYQDIQYKESDQLQANNRLQQMHHSQIKQEAEEEKRNNEIQMDIENDIQPLELRKSVIKEFEDNAAIYKPLFDERSNSIKRKINSDFNSATFSELVLKNITAREVFGIFFSNQIFVSDRLQRKFTSFLEFFILEYLHGTNVSVSEIQLPPPEIFNSIYSNNYLQLLEYPESSERHISFTHNIPNASAFLPKSLQCQMKETIYWQSPQSFTLVRLLSLKGAPIITCVEPRVVFYVDEVNGNTILRSGFYVHFKSNTMFKKIIEKSSKEENEKTWNELKNVMSNVSEEYIKKRDQNKLIVQKENEQNLVKFNPNEYEQYDENNLEQISNQSYKIPQLQQDQQQKYEEELSKVAAKASNQACNIF
ncbi:GRAM domain protein (macronuclear) [Tetrahymena thermophila SB210]|uniref:GRAM domain protein n=1 Tax=Tetrahymena thermophila (strain SB210) TaxID=312017 RepID=I7M5W4_TETTS|nr:GRAM domain protein [Tetrahymena thermophila SB210]EAR83328.3 GRAM domain protein [Tetrahymena thermophila SB210]|eukprot:XP_001030991.3 GRAM domain protein [Tetrahymena thermophila SB210]